MNAQRGFGRAVGAFFAAQLLVLAVVGALLNNWFVEPGSLRAIMVAAWVALGVQTLTFAIIRLVAREQVVAAWGVGVIVRFAAVALWAFLLVPAFALAPTPALLSLVAFLFVSTVIEPLFLNF